MNTYKLKLLFMAILPFTLNVTAAYAETCPSIPNYDTTTKTLLIPCVSVNGSDASAFRVDMQSRDTESGLLFTPTIIEPIPYVDIANPENQLDWIGRAHNGGVRYISANLELKMFEHLNKLNF